MISEYELTTPRSLENECVVFGFRASVRHTDAELISAAHGLSGVEKASDPIEPGEKIETRFIFSSAPPVSIGL